MEDHVHILASLGKSMSQSEWVKELKRVSSIWAKERDPSLAIFAWQGGYGSYSVGHDDLETVKRYIANQADHHRNETLEEEFLRMLIKHGMEWDPRDSWDD